MLLIKVTSEWQRSRDQSGRSRWDRAGIHRDRLSFHHPVNHTPFPDSPKVLPSRRVFSTRVGSVLRGGRHCVLRVHSGSTRCRRRRQETIHPGATCRSEFLDRWRLPDTPLSNILFGGVLNAGVSPYINFLLAGKGSIGCVRDSASHPGFEWLDLVTVANPGGFLVGNLVC